MVAKTLDVTPQAARRIVLELGLQRDDREGEVSGMACDLGSKSDTANYKVAPSGEPRLQKQV